METTLKKEIKPNIQQQKCIDNIEGAFMVLAGPGTGKTFTLTRRIQSMVQNKSINPSEILCLTYSDAAASEMKNRLIDLLGDVAVNLQIHTYHGFCNNVIQQFSENFNFSENVKVIDNISKEMLAKKCLDDANENGINLELLKDKWGNYYKAEQTLLKAVSDVKMYRLTEEKFLQNMNTNEEWCPLISELDEKIRIAKEKNRTTATNEKKLEAVQNKIEKAKLLWDLSKKYQELMYKNDYIDFDDMVGFVVDGVEADLDLGEKVFGNLKYILVDEYQDTNTIQNELIDSAVKFSSGENIFVVGDDDQIIYGFQGASLDNCENFLRKYPSTEVICLTENNRSTQTILDFGYQVVSQDDNRLENNLEFSKFNIDKKLTAKNQKINELNKKITYKYFDIAEAENNSIIEDIQKIIKNLPADKNLSDIAVLGRQNYQIEEIARLMEGVSIPYQKKTKKSIFEIPSSLLLYSYLKLLNNPKSSVDKQFPLLMHEPFKFDDDDYNFILSQNRPLKRDFISIIEENQTHNWVNPDKINNFLQTYKKLLGLKFTKSLNNFVLHVANETGILAYYANVKSDVSDNILAIKRLITEAGAFKDIYIRSFFDDEIKTGPYLSNFLEYLDKCYRSGEGPFLEKSGNVVNAVQLLTYHGSKGREFDYVFMPWLTADKFEKSRGHNDFRLPFRANSPDKELEKRSELLKLLFVGITRAKHDLRLSFSMTNDDKQQNLTSLLENILVDNPLVSIQRIENEDKISETVKLLKTTTFDKYDEELSERIDKLELNPHSLNNYKTCPRKYLYGNVFEIPTVNEDTLLMNYGTSIHYALQVLMQSAQKNHSYLDKDAVKKAFLDKLATFEFDDEETYKTQQKRGLDALDNCYHHLIEIPIENIYSTEYRFSKVQYSDMTLKGFIDFVEKKSDGTFALYDYKTGSAKSKVQIAKDKNYDNYYCQLAFYKIAFELQNKNAYVSETCLNFVEDSIINLQFSEEELQIVKDEMTNVIKNIKSHNFEPIDKINATCPVCKDCEYNLICRLQFDNNI